MNWLFLTLISVIVVSFAGIVQRVLMKGDKSNPYSYAIVFHILLGTTNLVLALVFGAKLSLFSGNIFFYFDCFCFMGNNYGFPFQGITTA